MDHLGRIRPQDCMLTQLQDEKAFYIQDDEEQIDCFLYPYHMNIKLPNTKTFKNMANVPPPKVQLQMERTERYQPPKVLLQKERPENQRSQPPEIQRHTEEIFG
jgi:hypothetical protein